MDARMDLIGYLAGMIHKITVSGMSRSGSSSVCGNRRRLVMNFETGIEYTVESRDTTKRDGYSREELYAMLREVRVHEKIGGWIVPEPDVEDVNKLVEEIRKVSQ